MAQRGGELRTAEVARIVGLRPAQIRALARDGLCGRVLESRRFVFDFPDLVILRAAQGLLAQGVSLARVRLALSQVTEALPDGRPLSGLRVYADGAAVAVAAEGHAWQPETGQTLFDFEGPATRRGPTQVEARARVDRITARAAALLASREFERGVALEAHDAEAAEAAYRRALELDADCAEASINLGRLRHESGDLDEARRLYEFAVSRAPEDVLAHYNLSVILEDQGEAEAAADGYRRALELEPAFADAHYNLAAICEQLGREHDAIRHYGEYRRLSPG